MKSCVEFKKSKYFSVSLDSTPDSSNVDQLTAVLRYTEDDGPVERFVTFIANKSQTVQSMFDALQNFF